MEKPRQKELCQNLKDNDWQLRIYAAKKLGSYKRLKKESIKALAKALGDSSYYVRLAAIQSLGKVGPRGSIAVDKLMIFLQDENKDQAKHVCKALTKIGKKASLQLIEELGSNNSKHHSLVRSTLIHMEKNAVQALIKGLHSTEKRLVEYSAECLGEIGTKAKKAIPQLENLLLSDLKISKYRIAHSLGQIGGLGIEVLENALQSPDEQIRISAANGLEKAIETTSITARHLLDCISGSDKLVEEVCRALASIGEEAFPIVPELILEFLKADRIPKSYIKKALEKIGPKTIPYLLDVFDEASEENKQEIMYLLNDFAPLDASSGEYLSSNLKESDNFLRSLMLRALEGSNSKRVASDLVELLGEDLSRNVRRSVFACLESMGPSASPALPALMELLEFENDHNGSDIASIIGKTISEQKDIQFLIEEFGSTLDFEHRNRIASVFRHLGPKAKEAAPLLWDVISNNDNHWFVGNAVSALGRMGVVARDYLDKLGEIFHNNKTHLARNIVEVVLHMTNSYPKGQRMELWHEFAGQHSNVLSKVIGYFQAFVKESKSRHSWVSDKRLGTLAKDALELFSEHQISSIAAREMAPKEPDIRTLNSLQDRFDQMKKHSNANVRGFEFERFLFDLFDAFGLNPQGSFRVGSGGEQIDGSFTLGDGVFLCEAKWFKKPVPPKEIRDFLGKIVLKANWTRGFFISVTGFKKSCRQNLRDNKRVICMDGDDLELVLEGKWNLRDALNYKLKKASELGDFMSPLPS